MSWIVWIFGFAVIIGASQMLRHNGFNDNKVTAVLLVGFLASVGYFFVGRAGLPGQPFHERAAELQARDPLSLTPDEALARFQSLVQEQPDAPGPHFLIAEALRTQGRFSEAVHAYRSSLRRDDRFIPAMIGLADLLTQMSGGEIDNGIKQIYARIVAIDPNQVRAGFMVGLADWQTGDTVAAEARWKTVRASIPENDPRQEMLKALIGQFVEIEAETPDLP